MNLIFEIGIVFAACFALYGALHALKAAICRPIHTAQGAKFYFVIAVSGDDGSLEETVRDVRQLLECSAPRARIIIADCGITGEAACIASALGRSDGAVVCRAEDLAEHIT